MGWRPRHVLSSTLPEIYLALEGWQLSRGQTPKAKPMKRERLLELAERYK